VIRINIYGAASSLVVVVVSLVCVMRWKDEAVTYLLGHRSDVNSSAAATVCFVRPSLSIIADRKTRIAVEKPHFRSKENRWLRFYRVTLC